MKNLKKLLIILFIVIIIIVLYILKLNNDEKKNNQKNTIEEYKSDVSGDFIKELGLVEDYRTYFSVEKMLQKFIEEVENKNNEGIYNLLDGTYILEKGISQENVLDKINDITQYASKVRVRRIYSQENSETGIYYIECILEKEHQGKENYFVLYKDLKNSTYSIAQIDKQTFEQKVKEEGQNLELRQIENNEYNQIISINPTEKEIVYKYFEDFLENALYYPEYAYSLLDKDYREKCFQTIEDFKYYIENKRELFESYDITTMKSYGDFENMNEYLLYLANTNNLELEQYQITKGKEDNKYLCIDSEGNYYTFYATSPMNYKIVLDNYTVPTKEFTEEYSKSTEQQKVILNIKRFFMGIDDKNYGYSYSVLSEGFRNNKYPTKNDFINYVKQNFFEENNINYMSCEKENNLYIYKIKVEDATGKNANGKEINVIVKINGGTDFEMSFGEN